MNRPPSISAQLREVAAKIRDENYRTPSTLLRIATLAEWEMALIALASELERQEAFVGAAVVLASLYVRADDDGTPRKDFEEADDFKADRDFCAAYRTYTTAPAPHEGE